MTLLSGVRKMVYGELLETDDKRLTGRASTDFAPGVACVVL